MLFANLVSLQISSADQDVTDWFVRRRLLLGAIAYDHDKIDLATVQCRRMRGTESETDTQTDQ